MGSVLEMVWYFGILGMPASLRAEPLTEGLLCSLQEMQGGLGGRSPPQKDPISHVGIDSVRYLLRFGRSCINTLYEAHLVTEFLGRTCWG